MPISGHGHRRTAYDLIVTPLLDCFPEDQIADIVAAIECCHGECDLAPHGFSKPQASLARLHSQAWLFAMYQFFRVIARIEDAN